MKRTSLQSSISCEKKNRNVFVQLDYSLHIHAIYKFSFVKLQISSMPLRSPIQQSFMYTKCCENGIWMEKRLTTQPTNQLTKLLDCFEIGMFVIECWFAVKFGSWQCMLRQVDVCISTQTYRKTMRNSVFSTTVEKCSPSKNTNIFPHNQYEMKWREKKSYERLRKWLCITCSA